MNEQEKSKVEALRTVFQRERERELGEHRKTRALVEAAGHDMHRPVSNAARVTETAAFDPSFGSLGHGQSTEAGLEVITTPARYSAPETRAMPSVAPLDAYWASYGSSVDRALVRGQDTALEVVIGDDDRVQIAVNENYPWRCICSLLLTANDGTSWIGTGWLVSPRVVLTAGHCVYMHNNGGWASRIEVIPGRNGASRPFGSAISSAFRSVGGWTESRLRDYDYGVILLPESNRYGDQLGWFGYAVKSDEELADVTVNLSGYPGDKPAGTQWFHSRRLKDVDDTILTYEVDTAGGQSGAPVWMLMQDGGRYGVGVHTNGALAGNSATRINQEVFNNIVSWVSQAP